MIAIPKQIFHLRRGIAVFFWLAFLATTAQWLPAQSPAKKSVTASNAPPKKTNTETAASVDLSADQAESPRHRPLDTTASISVLAFGSCNKMDKPQTMFSEIAANKPDVFIWLGDIIYADTNNMTALAAHYRRLKVNPEYKKLREKSQIIGIYDDHDYGANNAGKGLPNKAASKKCLLDFLDVPKNALVRKREGAYQSYLFGKGQQRIKIIVLDTRYFRDTLISRIPNLDGDILGEAQWQWLERELRNSPANLNILCSSIQVIADDHRHDKWGNFPNARKRLLTMISHVRPKNLLILSGDRHMAEISKLDLQGLSYPLYDFTSSGLTHMRSGSSETNHFREGKLVIQRNFGLLKIRWEGPVPIVTMEVRGLQKLFEQNIVKY